VQATDNNFVGGDVIPNYLESYFFLPKNHILVLSDYLFVNECLVLCCLHLFVFYLWQDIDIACMFIFSCLQFAGVTFSYCAENLLSYYAEKFSAPVGTNLVSSDSDSSILVWCSPKKMDQATTLVSSPRNGG